MTGVFYQYVAPIFDSVLGISQEDVLIGMLLLLFMVLSCVVLVGVFYDRVFKLWQESSMVSVERNPYSRFLLMPKEIILWKRCQLRILKEVAKDDPEAMKDIKFMDRWMDKLLEDPKMRRQVEETEELILS